MCHTRENGFKGQLRGLGPHDEPCLPTLSRRCLENGPILLAKSGGAARAVYLAGIGTRSAAEARHVPQAQPRRARARSDGAPRPISPAVSDPFQETMA